MALFLIVYVFLMFAFLIQFQIVWPLESWLLGAFPQASVSLLFLPHGIKAIVAVLGGVPALLGIAAAHFTTDLLLSLNLDRAVYSAFSGSIIMLLPLVMFNFMTHRKLFSGLPLNDDSNTHLFRVVLVVALVASLLNGVINSAVKDDQTITFLAFKYVFGDMAGTLLAFGLLMLLRRHIMTLLEKALLIKSKN